MARVVGNIVLYKGMATSIGKYIPVILSGELPSLTEKPGRPQSTGLQRVEHDQSDPMHIVTRLFLACGSDGTPLQYSCLENPMDGGAHRLQSMGSRRVRHD